MTITTEKSESAFTRASAVLVGGVNSPVRAYSAVGGKPPFIAKASGAKIYDIDGNEYIDYVGSYGPMILGHAHEQVTTAINKAIRKGTSFGASTEAEARLAERVIQAIPSAEKVRFTSSGTEAVMTAIRLARGYTGRDKIVKFIGCYHGHSDALLVQAGSGATTLGTPSSPGVPAGATADTILLPYNNTEAVKEAFAEYNGQIAAVILEPIAGNMGVIPPAEGYLAGLRELCTQNNTLLIFDEVMTGFRVAWGGAQDLYGVLPDITTFGKVVGGGMPVGALTGSAEIMDCLAPMGKVYQAGTLSGNPAAMAAGLATLDVIASDPEFYAKLETLSAALEDGLRHAAVNAGVSERIRLQRVGSMVCIFFSDLPVHNYQSATQCNLDAFGSYFSMMESEGIFLPPSQFESIFVSAAHTMDDIQTTTHAAIKAFEAAGRALHQYS